jgi:hypothetical protein
MKPNLKLTVVASLLLMSTVTFAQTATDTPVVTPVAKSAPVTTNALVANITGTEAKAEPKCKCDEVVKKPVVVKKKVVHKKVVKKPVKVIPQEINMVSQNNIVEEKPTVVEYYSYKDMRVVPQILPLEEKKGWGSRNATPKLVFNAVDEQGNPYPNENFISKNGANLTVIQMNTDLSKVTETELSTGTVFDPLFEKNNCQAIFLKYQLKGNTEYTGTRFFLNNEGQIENTLPPSCKVTTKDERDSTDYSSKGYISDVSFTKIVSVHTQELEFILHLVKNGKDYFGQNIKGYVVSNNFDDIYLPRIVPHRKGPYFGTTFIASPPKPGVYNVVIPFDVDEGKQLVRVTRTVR